MSSNIRSLVEQHIPRQYRGTREATTAVEGIVRDLTQARDNAAQAVRRAAQQKGVSESEVNEVLYGCGLADRPAPVAAAPAQTDDGSAASAIRRLESTVQRLVDAAAARGIRL